MSIVHLRWKGVRSLAKLARELPADRDADQHPDPGLLRQQRAEVPQPLIGILERGDARDLLLVARVEPAALGERGRQDLLELRSGVRDASLDLAEALGIGERLERSA